MTEPEFLADLADYSPRRSVCTVAQVLEQLDRDRADKLVAALTGTASAAAISGSLRRSGITLGAGTIGRHRRGECRCAR